MASCGEDDSNYGLFIVCRTNQPGIVDTLPPNSLGVFDPHGNLRTLAMPQQLKANVNLMVDFATENFNVLSQFHKSISKRSVQVRMPATEHSMDVGLRFGKITVTSVCMFVL